MSLSSIYLLADSQLLFWRDSDGTLLLDSSKTGVKTESANASYLGASNGDDPAYYSIFEAAMEILGVTRRRMIPSSFSGDDAEFLANSEIILLAGGDAVSGWQTFTSNGAREAVMARYIEGALFIGVSAGALQLGLCAYPDGDFSGEDLVETFKFVPLIIGAHDEKREWESLKKAVYLTGDGAQGVGIPAGGGAIYHPDGSLSPVRYPLDLFSLAEQQLSHSLLLTQDAPRT
jgi:Cyanophycinase and related exopeptidases